MNLGTDLTSAAHPAVLLNAYVVHAVVLAHFQIPGDLPTPRKLGAALAADAGIVILFARELGEGRASLLGDGPGRPRHRPDEPSGVRTHPHEGGRPGGARCPPRPSGLSCDP